MSDNNIINHLGKVLESDVEKIIRDLKENGVKFILEIVFNTLMKGERALYLKESTDSDNKANGYYSRMARTMTDYFKVKVPRDRLGLFRPIFLEIIENEKRRIEDLAFLLYVKGLSTRDIKTIIEKTFGGSYSATQVSVITKRFEEEKTAWQNKKLDKRYYFLYIDALHINVRRGNKVEKEAFYLVMGVKEDFTREILGVYNTPTESSSAWREHFQDMKKRGLEEVLLIISDELSGIENVALEVFKGASHQFCIVHKKRNIFNKVRRSDKAAIISDLKEVFKVGVPGFTKENAKINLNIFLEKWSKYPSLKNMFPPEKVDFFFSYLEFPYQIQSMIYTTNWIERLNKSVRKTMKNRNSMPSPESAMRLIIATMIDREEATYLKYPVTKFHEVKYELQKCFKGENDEINI